jgi:hypothetical protein
MPHVIYIVTDEAGSDSNPVKQATYASRDLHCD